MKHDFVEWSHFYQILLQLHNILLFETCGNKKIIMHIILNTHTLQPSAISKTLEKRFSEVSSYL